MKYAVVFPGQGSQSMGMLAELSEEYPIVKETYQEASDVLAYDLWHLIQENPGEKLNKTEFTQPAMLAAGVSVWRIWQSLNMPKPMLMAGHSLGEYTALVATNALSYSDAISLVAERGRLMQAAVPEGEGAMAAVLGLGDDVLKKLCADCAEQDVVEAVNFNSPGQIVIAGHSTAVNRVIEVAKEAGAKRALLLPVSVPSHSSLMKEAAIKLGETIAKLDIQAPDTPVLHNVDAAEHTSTDAITDALKAQLYSPVLWTDIVQSFKAKQVEVVLELGPGKVLAGLTKRIDRELQAAPVESKAGLEKALSLVTA